MELETKKLLNSILKFELDFFEKEQNVAPSEWKFYRKTFRDKNFVNKEEVSTLFHWSALILFPRLPNPPIIVSAAT